MSGHIQRILRAAERSPWAIQPEKLEVIAGVLAAKAQHGQIPTAAEIEAADRRTKRTSTSGGSVAVLPVFGSISRRMGMLDAMSGGVSLERFGQLFDEAVADDSVSSILLVIDSPGGSVYGVDEMARKIFNARSKKRIVAIADALMASAAYWIGTAAEELVVTPSGEVGSVGVYAMHFDWSERAQAEGLKVSIIRAGEHKAEGNPYEPLGDDARAYMQSQVDDYYQMFVRAVAKYRGVSVEKVRRDFGGGRTLLAKRALDAGMVDRIQSFDEVVSDLRRGKRAGQVAVAAIADAGIAASSTTGDTLTLDSHGSRLWRRALQLLERDNPGTDAGGDAAAAVGGAATVPSVLVIQIDSGDADRDGGSGQGQEADAAREGVQSTQDQPVADGDAAGGDDDTPDQQAASSAEEEAVSQTATAAQSGAATITDAERKRRAEIRALGRDYDVPAADVDAWIDNGATVETVQGELFRRERERAKVAPTITVGADREAERPFESLGHQLQAIRRAGNPANAPDKRLLHLNDLARRAQSGGTVTTEPSDAGFVIQPDFVEGIISHMWDEGRVLSRTNRVPIGPNANRLKRTHLAEKSRKTGSRYGGVRVYRAAEAHTVEGSKPKTRPQEIALEKLMGLWYVTEETLEDAVALSVEGERAFRREMTFVAEDEVFRGDGAGRMLGFLKSDALVTVTPQETEDQKGRISPYNVARMVAQFAGQMSSAVFYAHRGVVPHLTVMRIGQIPVFIPNQNISGGPFGSLYGIPVELVEYCEAPGTPGDLCLVDLQQYTTIDKRGVRWENSVHVRFIYDESAFKIVYRINGQPDWETSIEEYKGSGRISPFVVLGELKS